jgi:tetratricopeptide (TPR) repeat protein
VWLGKILEDTGRRGAAGSHFSKALQSTPREQDDWLLIARRLLSYETLGGAMETFLKRYQESFPECPQGRILLGKLCLDRGDTAGALAEFEAAHTLDPSIPWLPEKLRELRGAGPRPNKESGRRQ